MGTSPTAATGDRGETARCSAQPHRACVSPAVPLRLRRRSPRPTDVLGQPEPLSGAHDRRDGLHGAGQLHQGVQGQPVPHAASAASHSSSRSRYRSCSASHCWPPSRSTVVGLRAPGLFRIGIFVPYAVPGVVAALMWGYLYGDRFGLVRRDRRPLAHRGARPALRELDARFDRQHRHVVVRRLQHADLLRGTAIGARGAVRGGRGRRQPAPSARRSASNCLPCALPC